MLSLLVDGLLLVLHWEYLSVILVSTFLGLWIGAIPGLGPVMAMAILFPFTFTMEPLTGLLMLATIHTAGTYGGSISAILINVPGEPAAAATTFDGYALARRGMARMALGLSLTASFFGGLAGVAALILAAQPLVHFALRFGPPEYFALAVLGLCVVAVASRGSTLKGLVMGCVGLAVGFVGTDAVLGYPRFTFGFIELEAKIGLVPVLIGLFAVAELMHLMLRRGAIAEAGALTGRLIDGIRTTFAYPLTILRGLSAGIFVGIIPGIGAVTASLLVYTMEKRLARDPSRFGNGAPEGVIGPEVSNNACISAALIPTLTLGIPGSSGAALLLVAITVHGLRPGPLLFTGSPELIYGFFAGLLVGILAFVLLALLIMRWFAVITVLPTSLLAPLLLALSLVGAYAYDQDFLSVIYAVLFGIFGFVARQYGFPVIGLVMGLVLGSMAETAFHQSLQMSAGSYLIFLQRPLSTSILVACGVLLFGPALWFYLRQALFRLRGAGADKTEKPQP